MSTAVISTQQSTPKRLKSPRAIKAVKGERQFVLDEQGWVGYNDLGVTGASTSVYRVSVMCPKISGFDHFIDHYHYSDAENRQTPKALQITIFWEDNGVEKTKDIDIEISQEDLQRIKKNDHREIYSEGVLSLIFYAKEKKQARREKTKTTLA